MLVIYDGGCPFCSRYVRLLRLRQVAAKVELLSARSGDARLARYWSQGHDLERGMLVDVNGQVYAGPDAIRVLAACSTPSDLFNRLNWMLFSRRAPARLLYPLLKFGRRVALVLLRTPRLKAPVAPATSAEEPDLG